MNKLSIAVDLDSTLNNLDEVWILQDYNRMYNDNLTAEDLITWWTHEYVKPECGKKVYDIVEQPGYFRNLGIKDKWTVDGFKLLCDNFDVFIVSSCNPHTVVDKVDWIKEHLPFFNIENFVACHPKFIINCDYLIDDGPHNIESYRQKSILLDKAYNRNIKSGDYIRVDNWKDIIDYFSKNYIEV